MKILFDCRYVRFDHHDGISRFSSRLVEALAKRMPVEMLISDERQLNLLPDLPWHLIRSQTSLLEPWVAYQINKLQPDAVYSPMQTIGSWGRRFGLVLTLHDLIYHHHRTPPKFLPWYIRAGWWVYHLTWIPQRLVMNRPDEVVTISQTSRKLMEQHRLTRRPINVISNAADPVDPDAPARRAPAGRDLLYMGSFMPYKNVTLLARAMQHLPGYRLHLISKIKPREQAQLEALAPAGSLVVHNGLTDAEYDDLLDRAYALVHGSLEEGFGIPVIEAMAHGTPAVISDTPIFREVGGEAAVFGDPKDAAAFAAAVRTLEDPAEWERRSELSRAQARLFDWDRSAEVLYEVMRRVATKVRPEDR